MPGFGTTGRTYNNAIDLMNSLGVTIREIDITAASRQHFNDIGHSEDIHDVTYENTQARERTQILMNIANKEGGLVIGTGDLSELAMGWCTYNGDHMSMYGVNSGVPKTLIRYLVSWVANHKVSGKSADTLRDILDTPVSPELLPTDTNGDIAQKTEDIIGPYELHDFYLYYMANLFMMIFGLGMFGSTFLLPLYLQNSMGYTALQSGAVFLPVGIIQGLMSPLVGFFSDKTNPKIPLFAGIILLVISFVINYNLSFMSEHSFVMTKTGTLKRDRLSKILPIQKLYSEMVPLAGW